MMILFRYLLLLSLFCLVSRGVTRELPLWLNDKEIAANNTWALLVATSSTWMNYRHQADVCHAYQVLRQHGVSKERIIVMMYDDIAHNPQNPTPGVIINEPGGPNVYTGIHADYSRSQLTTQNFLYVLQGNAEAVAGVGSGKVISGDADSYIFLYIVDHGGPGIIAFPDKMLTASELNRAIKRMHASRSYKQMVIYVETCFAGSMFENHLPEDIGVYVMTAANSTQSSYACNLVLKLETYISDCFSLNWIKNTAAAATDHETLELQYQDVKKETTKSNVTQYGQLGISREQLEYFMGTHNSKKQHDTQSPSQPPTDAVPSGDVPISVLSHLIFESNDEWQKEEYERRLVKELMMREDIRHTVKTIVQSVTKDESITKTLLSMRSTPTQFDCIEAAAATFSKDCFNLSKFDYATQLLFSLVNLCEAYQVSAVMDAITMTCSH